MAPNLYALGRILCSYEESMETPSMQEEMWVNGKMQWLEKNRTSYWWNPEFFRELVMIVHASFLKIYVRFVQIINF